MRAKTLFYSVIIFNGLELWFLVVAEKKKRIFFSFSRSLFLPFHLVSSFVVIFSLFFLFSYKFFAWVCRFNGVRVQVGFVLNFSNFLSFSPDVMRWFASDSIATTKMPANKQWKRLYENYGYFFIHTGSSRTTLEKTNDMARWWWCVYAIACSVFTYTSFLDTTHHWIEATFNVAHTSICVLCTQVVYIRHAVSIYAVRFYIFQFVRLFVWIREFAGWCIIFHQKCPSAYGMELNAQQKKNKITQTWWLERHMQNGRIMWHSIRVHAHQRP